MALAELLHNGLYLEMILAVLATLAVGGTVFAVVLLRSSQLCSKLERVADRWGWIILMALVAMYCSVYCTLSILKFNAYNMGRDLAYADQSIYNTLQGRLLEYTPPPPDWDLQGRNISALAIHGEFINALLCPLFLLWDDARILLVVQTLFLALGAVPVYLLARDAFDRNLAGLIFSAGYLLYPALGYANLFDYHADPLATPFLLFSLYSLHKRLYARFIAFMVFSMLCKQYIGLAYFMIGLYVIWKHKKYLLGVSVSLAGLGWFLIVIGVVNPLYANGHGSWVFERGYGTVAGGIGIGGMIRMFLQQPFQAIRLMLTPENVGAFALLLTSVGLLPFWGLEEFLLSMPLFLGWMTVGMDIRMHHGASIVPFIFISSVFGAKRLVSRFRANKGLASRVGNAVNDSALYAVLASFAVCSLLGAVLFGPSPLSWKFWAKSEWAYWHNLHNYRVSRHDFVIDQFITEIPSRAAVETSEHILPHLTHRQTAYPLRDYYTEGQGVPEYVLIDLLEYTPLFWMPRQLVLERARFYLANPRFTLIRAQDGLLLFRQMEEQSSVQRNRALFHDISFVESAAPIHSLNAEIGGGELTLLGYDVISNTITSEGVLITTAYYWQVNSLSDRQRLILDVFSDGEEDSLVFVHIPSYVLLPTTEWERGRIVREVCTVLLPGRARSLRQRVVVFAVPSSEPEPMLVADMRDIPPWSNQQLVGEVLLDR